jgi:flavodoxin
MKIAIFYKTHLGSTRNYAKWLQEYFNADLYLFRQFKKAKPNNYDIIVVSSGTYVGRMPLVKFLEQTWAQVKNKIVIVIAVGIDKPRNQSSIDSYNMIPENIRANIKYFKLPGKLNNNSLATEVKPENLKPVIKYIESLIKK